MQTQELLPMEMIDTLFGECDVRIAIAIHPITKEPAGCISYKDLARALTYEESAIKKMIYRTSWLKKYSTGVIMSSVDGKMRTHLCLFEQGALGVVQKLQPTRCKNPEIGRKLDQKQEELTLILHKTLKGYQKNKGIHDNLTFVNGKVMVELMKMAGKGNPSAIYYLEKHFGIPARDLALKAGGLAPPLPFPESKRKD